MADFLSDQRIEELLKERKRVPSDFSKQLTPKPKRGHAEVELDITGEAGAEFRVIVRRSNINILDFSVIPAYRVPGSNQLLRLRRYNGRSHEHTNPIEGQTFYDFHIHTATERYQGTGNREDTYAEPTDRYGTIDEAVGCLVEDCGFILPEDSQRNLFPL